MRRREFITLLGARHPTSVQKGGGLPRGALSTIKLTACLAHTNKFWRRSTNPVTGVRATKGHKTLVRTGPTHGWRLACQCNMR
jgi:hypothetical protein